MPISYASVLMGVSASRPEARGWDAYASTVVMTDVRAEGV
jgi:hypothetical protein